MPKIKNKGDVHWFIPNRKRPIAYSTISTKHLIAALSLEHETIQDVYNHLFYDTEAKNLLKIYIDKGYGNEIARHWFSAACGSKVILEAIRNLGYKNAKVQIVQIAEDRYCVKLNGEYFGVFDIKRNTFVD